MSLIPRPPLESDIIGLPSAYWKILRVRRALEVSPDDHSPKDSSEHISASSINATVEMPIREDPFSARFDSRTPAFMTNLSYGFIVLPGELARWKRSLKYGRGDNCAITRSRTDYKIRKASILSTFRYLRRPLRARLISSSVLGSLGPLFVSSDLGPTPITKKPISKFLTDLRTAS